MLKYGGVSFPDSPAQSNLSMKISLFSHQAIPKDCCCIHYVELLGMNMNDKSTHEEERMHTPSISILFHRMMLESILQERSLNDAHAQNALIQIQVRRQHCVNEDNW
jgi:hypothetical protein